MKIPYLFQALLMIGVTSQQIYRERTIGTATSVSRPQAATLHYGQYIFCCSQPSNGIRCQFLNQNLTLYGVEFSGGPGLLVSGSITPLQDTKFIINNEDNSGALASISIGRFTTEGVRITSTHYTNPSPPGPASNHPNGVLLPDYNILNLWLDVTATPHAFQTLVMNPQTFGVVYGTNTINVLSSPYTTNLWKWSLVAFSDGTGAFCYIDTAARIMFLTATGTSSGNIGVTPGDSTCNLEVLSNSNVLMTYLISSLNTVQAEIFDNTGTSQFTYTLVVGTAAAITVPQSLVFSDDSFATLYLINTEIAGQAFYANGSTKSNPTFIGLTTGITSLGWGISSAANDTLFAFFIGTSSGKILKTKRYDSSLTDLCMKDDVFGVCYSCYVNDQCELPLLTCNTTNGLCYCSQDSQCPSYLPYCALYNGECIQCRTSLDCPYAACSDQGECVPCKKNQECNHKYPYCNIENGICTQCNGNYQCDGDFICNSTGFCSLPPEPPLPEWLNGAATGIATAAVSVSLAQVALSSDPSTGTKIISLFQHFYFLLYIGVSYPERLKNFLIIFKLGILSFFPNFIKPSSKNLSLPAPANLYALGFDGYFFDDGSAGLTTMVILLGAWLVSKSILKIQIFSKSKIFEKGPAFFSKLIIRAWLIFCPVLMYSSILQLYQINFTKEEFAFGSIFALIFPLLSIFFGFFWYKHIYSSFSDEYRSELKTLGDDWILHSNLLVYIRKVVEPVLIVVLYYHPFVLTSLLSMISLFFTFYWILKTPLKKNHKNLLNASIDGMLTLCYFFILRIIQNSFNTANTDIAVMTILMIILVVMCVITLIAGAFKLYRAIKNARKPKDTTENKEGVDQAKLVPTDGNGQTTTRSPDLGSPYSPLEKPSEQPNQGQQDSFHDLEQLLKTYIEGSPLSPQNIKQLETKRSIFFNNDYDAGTSPNPKLFNSLQEMDQQLEAHTNEDQPLSSQGIKQFEPKRSIFQFPDEVKPALTQSSRSVVMNSIEGRTQNGDQRNMDSFENMEQQLETHTNEEQAISPQGIKLLESKKSIFPKQEKGQPQ